MVENNKILTVSYGSFSCTLEGFDDSFGAMKVVAEYFRDLAADDRFFGAEPPTPDSAMLARLTEKEISRRVEARSDATGITLRAEPAPETVLVDAERDLDSVSQDAPRVDQPEDALSDDVDAETQAPEITAERVADGDVFDGDGSSEDNTDEAASDAFLFSKTAPMIEDGPDASAPSEDLRVESDGDAPQDSEADMPGPEVEKDNHDAPVGIKGHTAEVPQVDMPSLSQPDGAPDNVAEKLARIRAVVSGMSEASEFIEDQHADTTTSAISDPDMPVSDDWDEAQPAASCDESEDSVDEALVTDAEPLVAGPRESAQVVRVKRRKQNKARPEGHKFEYVAEDPSEPQINDPLVLDAASRVSTPLDQDPIGAPNMAGQLDDDEAGGLSPEEEEDLMRALAEVEADVVARDTEKQDVQGDAEPQATPPRRLGKTAHKRAAKAAEVDQSSAPEKEFHGELRADDATPGDMSRRQGRGRNNRKAARGDDSDVARLMAAADEQMAEPEGRQRRKAIAHLRAAVAATKDTQEAVPDSGDDEIAQYARDLDAVRPESASPSTPSAAPLQLVAEQRVNIPERASQNDAGAHAGVRPRRISPRRPMGTKHVEAASEAAQSGFVAYADAAGARSLPHIMEAAAAYLTLIEKRPQFSRPQLMTKVREAEAETLSREDRLRAFGQLLREGKIEKTTAGQFQAAEHIGFRPNRRAAG